MKHNLNGAIQLDHSTNMSVNVSTCTSHDFSVLMAVVWKLCISTSCCKNEWSGFRAKNQH